MLVNEKELFIASKIENVPNFMVLVDPTKLPINREAGLSDVVSVVIQVYSPVGQNGNLINHLLDCVHFF